MARKKSRTGERKPRTTLSEATKQKVLEALQVGLDEATLEKVAGILNPVAPDPLNTWMESLDGDVRQGGPRRVAWEIVRPFTCHVESGVFALVGPGELKRKAILSGVNAAVERHFKQVQFISASQMARRPRWEWVTDAAYRSMLRTGIREATGVPVDQMLGQVYAESYQRLDAGLRESIEACFKGGVLRGGLQQSVVALFKDSLAYDEGKMFVGTGIRSTGGLMYSIVCQGLRCLLAFTFAGEEQHAKKLLPFVTLLAQCVPLASKGGSPETLLVLSG